MDADDNIDININISITGSINISKECGSLLNYDHPNYEHYKAFHNRY